MCGELKGSSDLLMLLSSIPPARNLFAAFAGSLLKSQQELWGVLLGVRDEVLKALHLRESADATLL